MIYTCCSRVWTGKGTYVLELILLKSLSSGTLTKVAFGLTIFFSTAHGLYESVKVVLESNLSFDGIYWVFGYLFN